MSDKKFFVCKHCGNLVELIHDSGVSMVCCGDPMTELVANTVEASVEKHIPVVTVEGNKITAKVGSVEHPMVDEHYIEWIYLQTEKGGQRKNLLPGEAPEASFLVVDDEKPVVVFAYCNLHGLWKAEV
ncbi:desulfoferrodoxin family protein [Clostridium aminobutyricum]|uniref:Desulfoferrodoxin n=1 Tax=Clostridium aminobutyricum TaxID=33953 RepID=A0A939IGZ0_CLOAM|nr:desulfoferrodoxin family protein [Clostridium aminobutyricum]MBN7774190.1 desulfoferrodoxin [Clostridium aminobutyricum]